MMSNVKRTQVQLEEDLYEEVRRRAFEERKSISAVIRETLRATLLPDRKEGRSFGFTFPGTARGGPRDVAERHDDYLGEGERW